MNRSRSSRGRARNGAVFGSRSARSIAEIEIQPAVQPADTDMYDTFRRIEMRLRLDHVQSRLEGFRTRCALRRLEKAARQPSPEALAADRPGLPMTVDMEIGEAGPIR